jgi:hypothetical protein
MKTCSHCNQSNPNDADYCNHCGNRIKHIQPAVKKSIWAKLPSWAWVFIGMGAIALLLLIIIGSFYSLAHFEGVASILFLIAGGLVFRVFSGTAPSNNTALRAILIGFFALMGATIDQTGNYLYNKPVEIWMCPDSTSLQRSTVTSHPLPGRTDMTQNFTCYKEDVPVEMLDMLPILGIRFLEYMLLAYLLIGLRWLVWRYKRIGK